VKILIAEDDADIRSLLRDILEYEGHDCETAEDGLAAMRLFEEGHQYELLISDYRMPNTDGLGLLRWCRERRIRLPVILLSASRVLLKREQIALEGCSAAYLHKPVNMDDLLSAVNACH
jgi:DNA-binding response OmpR family regulator